MDGTEGLTDRQKILLGKGGSQTHTQSPESVAFAKVVGHNPKKIAIGVAKLLMKQGKEREAVDGMIRHIEFLKEKGVTPGQQEHSRNHLRMCWSIIDTMVCFLGGNYPVFFAVHIVSLVENYSKDMDEAFMCEIIGKWKMIFPPDVVSGIYGVYPEAYCAGMEVLMEEYNNTALPKIKKRKRTDPSLSYGEAELESENYEQALSYFRTYSSILDLYGMSATPALLISRCTALIELGEYGPAMNDAQELVFTNNSWEGWELKGRIFHELNDVKQAIYCMKTALAKPLPPADTDRLKQRVDALNLEGLIKSSPPELLYLLRTKASNAFVNRSYHLALFIYKKLLSLDKENHLLHLSNHTACLIHLKKNKAGLQQAEQVASQLPTWHKGWERKGKALLGLGKTSEAKVCALKRKPVNPADPWAMGKRKRVVGPLKSPYHRMLWRKRYHCNLGTKILRNLWAVFKRKQPFALLAFIIGMDMGIGAKRKRVVPCIAAIILVFVLVQISKTLVPTYDSDKYVFTGDARMKWEKARIWKWQREMGWVVGANYVPATAINQLEMFQEATWDPKRIRFELQLASKSGMNCMRVFLHDLLFESDKEGLFKRMNEFLSIASFFDIKILFVLFDACWRGAAKLGPQPEPIPFTHNSGWLQSPTHATLRDESKWDKLQDYVTSVLQRFKDDSRIVGWDLYNEPSNFDLDFQLISKKLNVEEGAPDARHFSKTDKQTQVLKLLQLTFQWARAVGPSQPLTTAIWGTMTPDDMDKDSLNAKFTEVQLTNSDVISFHSYSSPADMQVLIDSLRKFDRPIMCTEYLARGYHSTILGNLPVLHRQGISAFNWGLFDGKTQTVVCNSTSFTHHSIRGALGTKPSQKSHLSGTMMYSTQTGSPSTLQRLISS